MNAHSPIGATNYVEDPGIRALELMVEALHIIDDAGVPGDVGAHLDHSIQRLALFLKKRLGAGDAVSFG